MYGHRDRASLMPPAAAAGIAAFPAQLSSFPHHASVNVKFCCRRRGRGACDHYGDLSSEVELASHTVRAAAAGDASDSDHRGPGRWHWEPNFCHGTITQPEALESGWLGIGPAASDSEARPGSMVGRGRGRGQRNTRIPGYTTITV